MPRIPTYQSGQVGPVETTNARFRAPDMPRSGLAEGMQGFGQAVAQYAQVQDQIVAQSEDTQARAAALEARSKLNETVTNYGTLQGGNAVDAQGRTLEQLKAIRDQAGGAIKSPRMKSFFDQHFEESYADAVGRVNGHALQQVQVQRKGVFLAEQAEAQDVAAVPGLYKQPDKFDAAIGQVRERSQAYADFAGLGAASSQYVKEQVGGAYEAAVHQALGAGEVDYASAIFDAHNDAMTADQKNRVFAALQKPLRDRKYDAIFTQATTGIAPTEPGKGYQTPVAGARITDTYADHEARGSKGLDLAAPLGAAIHPIAGGVITKVTEDDQAGKWVMVKHPDGTTSTYSHMGNQSVKEGDEVTSSTVLGTVGVTGHTTGPHVHLRTRDANGADVDPEKLIGGKPVGVAGASDTARNYDQAQVIKNIKAMGLSPEDEQGAIDHALGKMRQSEQILSDQQGDVSDRVHQFVGDYVAKHGGKYPPPEALPAFAAGMKPSELAELKGTLARAQKADNDEAVRKQQDWTALQATLRMYNDPQGFLTADIPKEYLGKVDAGSYAQIVTAQARMRQDASKPQEWHPFQDSKQALDTYLLMNPPANGKLSDGEKAAALQTIKDVATEYTARTGRPPTDSDWQDIAKRSMRKVQVPGALWGTNDVTLYNVKSVPKDAHATIAATFKRVYKRDPSEDEVLQWYRQHLASAPQ